MPFIAYFFVLVLTAVTGAVSLDYLTAPDIPAPKHVAAKAADAKQANAIRQVPIGRTTTAETNGQATAKADDKADARNEAKNDKDLTPIYPAAPGKNLPDAQTADADNKPADKTADANAADKPQTPPAQVANATPVAANLPATPVSTQASVPTPAGACAIQACASAYRSFRASDCTYQPYGGARKLCDLSADGARQASNSPAALPVSQGSLRGGTVGRSDDFDDVVRTVRHLPPQAEYDDEGDGYDGGAYDRGRIVVIRRDGPRPAYGPRWIYEDR